MFRIVGIIVYNNNIIMNIHSFKKMIKSLSIDHTKPIESIIAFLYPNLSRPETSRFTSLFQENKEQTKPSKPKKGKLFISIDSINEGIDKRTSIMIKNLPNTTSIEQLQIQLKSICKINYLYIPTNSRNKILGFAFMNVEYYKDIVKLYETLHEKEFNNKKVELCYSKVQGVKNLSKAFGNEQ